MRLPLLLALLALLVVPTAARGDVGITGPGPQYPTGTVDELERRSAVREYLGFSVYSKWDPAIERYRLTVLDRDADAVPTPIAPQATPFDVDIGPDSAGRRGLAARAALHPPAGRAHATLRGALRGGIVHDDRPQHQRHGAVGGQPRARGPLQRS